MNAEKTRKDHISNATLLQGETDPLTDRPVHLLQLDGIGKHYGNIIALRDVTMAVDNGRVTCVLGDNGAGKSTLIKIIAGLHQHDEGTLTVMGEERKFSSPRDALDAGIATVYQDLAVVPLMPIWRNFFLGSELTTGFGPFKRLDVEKMKEITKNELADMGIDLRDVEQPIGQLSGGERQCVAIARAVYFGAKVLILDEPTAALGVKQSGVVLRYILQARDRGLGVIFITHNPHHAYPVGDRFLLLKRGKSIGYHHKKDITLDELTGQMAGGAELAELAHELEAMGGHTDILAEVEKETASIGGESKAK
ncbi:monosaccharide ABC transporter ATP-binding protein, CUT2 family [Arthrobacter subterraneus]|uniref:Monosaccharide ABC transporter ATP-binding protein, CUT2 family n=1 Tax=Arthrobacter subterraneus TaxID=335973 RepID=A0A1G8HBE5_9MICC|nr:ATP-binding cassette domain-containing protein [Arthrobacter subterraneus]SDI04004.1 monosaccharide ABC transporter ATP-binding protein, CUT2 family [Arthrobacter subterraneus]